MTTYSDDRGSREERLSRLDQMEREIASERDRLTRHGNGAEPADERRDGPTRADEPTDSTRRVDLPELEERVTESQREAWAMGYQSGVADSKTRTGSPTQNPFHPLRGL